MIGFGSCNKQNLPQDYWSNLLTNFANLTLFALTGDSVYTEGNQLNDLKSAFHSLANNEHFEKFRSRVEVIGTWDDHDFGINDGGGQIIDKEERLFEYLNFFQLHNQSKLYYSRDIQLSEFTIKLIFLDTRYYRDSHYVPSLGEFELPYFSLIAAGLRVFHTILGFGRSYGGDMLGISQWEWLNTTLQTSQADFNIVISSIQVLTTNPAVESWGHYPVAKHRLLHMLGSSPPRGLALISGDVHHAEMSSAELHRASGRIDTLVEVTSSGLTHSCGDSKLTRLLCPAILNTFYGHRLGGQLSYFLERNVGTMSLGDCDSSTHNSRSGKPSNNSGVDTDSSNVCLHIRVLDLNSPGMQTVALSHTVHSIGHLNHGDSLLRVQYATFPHMSNKCGTAVLCSVCCCVLLCLLRIVKHLCACGQNNEEDQHLHDRNRHTHDHKLE